MAGGFTTVGKVLSLIGNAPVKHSGTVVSEGLKVAKSLIPHGSGLKGLLDQVMKGGLGSVLQNPMAALTGQLNGAIGGLMGNLAGLDGAGILSQALGGVGGLQAALGQFGNVGNLLSGLGMPGEGQFGLLDAIGHGGVGEMLGGLTGSLGLDKVLGPIASFGEVGNMLGSIETMASDALAGNLDVFSAFAAVTDMTAQINGIVSASHTALSTVQNSVLGLASVNAIAGSIRTAEPDMLGFLQSVTQPAAWDAMNAALMPIASPETLDP